MIAAITVLFATQLPGIRINNDITSFVPDDHPDRLALETVDEIFGEDMAFSIGIEILNGTIFTPESIRLVGEITGRFGELDSVDSVTSISNLEIIQGSGGGMSVERVVEELPDSDGDIQAIKAKLLSWELYRGLFVSDDYTSTQIILTHDLALASDAREELYLQVKSILEEYESPAKRFYIAGEPVVTLLISRNTRSDVALLIPIVVLVVTLVLYLFFRRISGVILPLLTVVVSTIWTLGLMVLLNVPLTIVSTVIPVLLVAVGSAYGIHLINHYYHDRTEAHGNGGDSTMDHESHRELVLDVVRKIGKPVLLAGLTTFVGFGALVTSSIGPMRSFGIFTAVGVLVAVIVALLLIPAILLTQRRFPAIREQDRARERGREKRKMYLEGLYRFFSASKLRIVVFTGIIVVASMFGAARVVVDNDLIAYFKEGADIRESDEFLRRQFAGTRTFSVVVTGQEPGDLTSPEVLYQMDRLAETLRRHPDVGSVISYSDFIKRMNQVMHADAASPHAGQVTAGSAAASGVPATEPWAAGPPGQEDDGDSFGGSWGASGWGEAGDEASWGDDASAGSWGESAREAAPAGEVTAGVAELLADAYTLADRADISAIDLIELVGREVNYRGAAYYEIPYDPGRYPVSTRAELGNLISQYLLLFSGNLDDFADDALEPTQARMRVQLSATGSTAVQPLLDRIDAYVEQNFPAGYTVSAAGTAIVESAVSNMITDAQVRSIIVSLSLVFLIVAVTFRSLIAGLYGILPLGLTLLVNFAVMGFGGIRLDVATAMVSSVAIGIGIDYTIHFLSAYKRERLRHGSVKEAEKRTLRTTGRAITFNAISVAAGFAVLILSRFNPLMHMGGLIAVTMLVSSTASLTILPVPLGFFKPRFIST